ncbi:MAG: nascent polypeptide-associated complex protein [Nanoarchaeota archaeon]|nr:nascent polypeptide-associated complex protein [DPANN group archaeon]MBL7117100.1 nascent polypeptide-associated complex protein [Nanoarchaeota archaeon]
MFPGINPRQMKQVMKKMGMQQQDIEVNEVIFKMNDKDIVISNPTVSKINMMGQETYQVVGEIHEKQVDTTHDISEEDIQIVMSQTNCSKEEAIKAIKKSKGDLAEAIMSLKS